ncbi:MAG: lipid-A-disaccharide synthase [Bacteroidia bacterium]|nr:lipid-A-disaccharide synthase [Bacteroidia bacterium]
MKYFIIAGEPSGDLHGSNLIQAIQQKDKQSEIKFWGGDWMKQKAPDGLLTHYKEITTMGIVEVVKKLGSIFKNMNRCKSDILNFKPDVVVFIDFPGFNIRIAEFCKTNGIKTAYYIAPKIWAWKEYRGKKLEKFIDELIIIFPFEVEYFKKWKVNCTYVGNPLLDSIANYRSAQLQNARTQNQIPTIALLPGSRRQEITKILPVMLSVVKHFPNHKFVVAGVSALDNSVYAPFVQDNIEIVYDKTYQVLENAEAAVVCSGTATLETALLNVPQVCGYIANPISVWIARKLVSVKYASLVNLCLNRFAITELIQEEFTTENIVKELSLILPNGEKRETILNDYAIVRAMLDKQGASSGAAEVIINLARKQLKPFRNY